MKLWNDKYPKSQFEIFGFYKEIWLNNKFMGTIRCEYDKDRKVGYTGRQDETFDDDIITDSRKVIKAGTKIQTLYCLLYGTRIN